MRSSRFGECSENLFAAALVGESGPAELRSVDLDFPLSMVRNDDIAADVSLVSSAALCHNRPALP